LAQALKRGFAAHPESTAQSTQWPILKRRLPPLPDGVGAQRGVVGTSSQMPIIAKNVTNIL
jgi:hypothetical protein